MLKTTLIILAVLALLLVLAVFLLATYVLPYAILQPPRRTNTTTPADFGLPYEHFKFKVAEDLELDAFYVPATTVARANLIMLHGVGSCKEVYLGSVAELVKAGYNVLLWDQRAHGKSGGEYLTYGYHEKYDVSKAIDWLEARNPTLPTGIYGNSMGGAVAIQSMAGNPGLRFGLIESTFTDLPAVANAYGRRLSGLPLPHWLSDYVLYRAGRIADFEPFTVRPVEAARKVTQPIMHIHGDADANINVSHAHALFEAYASEDKTLYIVENGDHADLWEKGGDGYRDVWFGFLMRTDF
ncbi:alpha/beta hydrolase [Neolewinella aurantiaca]|nr:alpha/beta fold hydrolase [Neolewinella aurantiaca]